METEWWQQNTDNSKFTVSYHSHFTSRKLVLVSRRRTKCSRSGSGSKISTSTLLVEKGLRKASSLTCILNTHRLKLLLGGFGQFRQVQATQRQRHRQRSKRTPETYRQRKMRRARGREKSEGGLMEHDIGVGEVSASERKQNGQNRSSGLMKFSEA